MSHDAQPRNYEKSEQVAPLLHHPDIRNLYDLCISTDFSDETAYLQGILALVHACDLAYQDENAGHTQDTVDAVERLLADIHCQTGHLEYYSGDEECPVSARLLLS